MLRRKLPLTAETYIGLNWGSLPDEIDPEDQELLDALDVLSAHRGKEADHGHEDEGRRRHRGNGA
jgi:hypothetical protein